VFEARQRIARKNKARGERTEYSDRRTILSHRSYDMTGINLGRKGFLKDSVKEKSKRK